MTVQEFETVKAVHPCVSCGHLGVVTEIDPQNGGAFIRCPKCLAKKTRAWPRSLTGGDYLAQKSRFRRKERPLGKGLYEIWEQQKKCCLCSATQAELIFMRIGLQSHHVDGDYRKNGDAGLILAMCQPCHAIATARQREMRQWLDRLREIYGQSVSGRGPGVSAPGLSPDPVCPEGETPTGGVEEFSDDDAND